MTEKPNKIEIIGTRGYPSYYGGFETAVRKIAPYLADRGWKVTVASRPGSIKQNDPEADRRVRSRETMGLNNRSLSTLSFGLTSCIAAAFAKPDVALVMNVANGFFLPLLKARGVNTVVNVDGIEWEREKWGKVARAVFWVGAWMTARFADELVYDSQSIAEYWKSHFHRSGTFIPYGGDSSVEIEFNEQFLPYSYALMVARLVPENTVIEFLKAAESIAASHTVVIVGSSGFGGEIDDAASFLDSSNPNVHWLGHISDDKRLHSLWQHAGVYFHGHSVGGTNPALVQAMALGTPVVARDTAYNREVLGAEGVFVPPNPGSIAAEILDLLNDAERRKTMGDRLKRRAAADYAWGQVCAAYEETMLNVIKTSAKKPR